MGRRCLRSHLIVSGILSSNSLSFAAWPTVVAHSKRCKLQVRREAYTALNRFPLEVLEQLELARPLQDTTNLLIAEPDHAAQRACEDLVKAALGHEQARKFRSARCIPSCWPALGSSACFAAEVTAPACLLGCLKPLAHITFMQTLLCLH